MGKIFGNLISVFKHLQYAFSLSVNIQTVSEAHKTS
jgi:hypothetical protein